MISQYLKHKPECAVNQNWDEARQALADTPNQFRDADYYIACEELEQKARTCTCGLDTLKPRIVLLPEDLRKQILLKIGGKCINNEAAQAAADTIIKLLKNKGE